MRRKAAGGNMEFFKTATHIDFMGKRWLVAAVLAVLIATSLGSLFIRGLALGLDFTGGTLIEVSYAAPVDLSAVREALTQAGFGGAVVQHVGSPREVMVRLAPRAGENSAQLNTRVLGALQQASADKVDMRRVEFVGAQVGDELTEQGGLAMLFALIGILIYVALRFEWRFSLGAVLATVHDAIFTLGFFSLFQIEFDLTVMAAVLAVIGYSLNDTIVVFDRIRENFRRMRTGKVVDVMNVSINQTLSRTIMTALTTMLVVVALFTFGGQVVHGFALALIIGILIGTVSSIYVASPLALWLGITRANLAPVRRAGAETDVRP
jgi:preprotein translocase subunit SecF